MSLEKAMQVEKEYLALKDTKDFNFNYQMGLHGYKDLEQYHTEKFDWFLKHSDFIVQRTSPQSEIALCRTNTGIATASNIYSNESTDYIDRLGKAIKHGKQVLYIFEPTGTCVYVGQGGDYNEKFCVSNKIVAMQLFYGTGGTIVANENDLGLCFALSEKNQMPRLTKKIGNALRNLGVENEVNGNDIMIKGGKIVGGSDVITEWGTMYFFQISFKVDVELISKISYKPMEKTPAGINDISDIKREDLIKEILSWLP